MSGKLHFVAAFLATHGWFERLRFDASGFAYDAPEDFGYCTSIKRSSVGLLQRLQHCALTFRIAERQSGNSLETANLHCESSSPVQELQQFPVYFVDFRTPVFDIHGGDPFLIIPGLITNKKASRDFFPFGSRGWLV
jgi:hypothetical protein